MKFKDLSGRIHTLNLSDYRVSPNDTRPRSSLHLRCRDLLKKLFPFDPIYEEVLIPGEQLFLDFFLPSRKLAIEVQGQQHDTYVHFFHGSQAGFKKAQANDRRKEELASLNNIKLIGLNYNESDGEWAHRIVGR